jgi:hypothetical protein
MVGTDSFQMEDRSDRIIVFTRDARGCVRGVTVAGLGYSAPLRRLDQGDVVSLERVARGDMARAVKEMLQVHPDGDAWLIDIGRRMSLLPSHAGPAARFLEQVAAVRPGPAVYSALGNALVAAGDRTRARAAFLRAYSADSSDADARAALVLLGALPARDTGWRLPFPTAALFQPPARTEIESVRADWARRDLSAKGVRELFRRVVDVNGTRMTARLVEHTVHGERHVGAILVPEGAKPGCCPVVLEAKGVSPSFFPLRVPEGLSLPEALGPDLKRVVYAIPGFRGEVVWVGGDSLISDGDRSDAWDGATDDLLSLLSVVAATIPEADTARVCTFGRSRGGSVALLAAARDRRVDCVVSWAAPTDWFELMGLQGWTQRELVEDGLRRQAEPGEPGGQFINYFLRPAIDSGASLAAIRRHLIASSPLYAASGLPAAQAHYGLEDPIVPIRNGYALGKRMTSGKGNTCQELVLHRDAGHDQDLFDAPRRTGDFLRRHLFPSMSRGRHPACAR